MSSREWRGASRLDRRRIGFLEQDGVDEPVGIGGGRQRAGQRQVGDARRAHHFGRARGSDVPADSWPTASHARTEPGFRIDG
jgi:hypothetical protein